MKTKRAYLYLLTIASTLLFALGWSAAATGAATAETLGITPTRSRVRVATAWPGVRPAI